jgi:hypothetical protein
MSINMIFTCVNIFIFISNINKKKNNFYFIALYMFFFVESISTNVQLKFMVLILLKNFHVLYISIEVNLLYSFDQHDH